MKVLKRWIDRLFALLGYTPTEEYTEACKLHKRAITEVEKVLEQLRNQLDAANAKLEEVGYDAYVAVRERNAELERTQDKIQKDVEETTEFYKSVQSSITGLLQKDPILGFPQNMVFPGATSVDARVMDGETSDEKIINISGRTIFTDDITAKIHDTTNLNDKYMIAVNQLIKLGLTDHIMKQIINYGGLQLTFGYNEGCTSIELYYNVQCVKPKVLHVVKRNDEK